MYILILFLLTKFTFAEESYKIEGSANNIIIDLIDQNFEAIGGSTATFTNIKVEARKITKDKNKNKIIAEGKITYLQDNRYKVVADTLELDLDKKIAKMKRGKTALNKFYLTGEEIEAKFPEKLTVNNATITTCSHNKPHFYIRAKRVDFYPNSKFIGYKGWIYIGEKFKLFPIPIYGSYVSEKENKAPLFPKIDYDKIKGFLIIYGVDFKLLDNKKFGPIDRVNLRGLVNLEYSQNRGLGFNKIRAGYDAMNILKGEMIVDDWISAPTESKDIKFSNRGESIGKGVGTSYKFTTKNILKSIKALPLNFKDNEYLLGESNISFEYKNTDSDLVKDQYGRYAKRDIKNKSSQTQLTIDQKIWKYLHINYKLRSIKASEEVMELLFKSYDRKAKEKAEKDKYLMDTKRENHLKIVEDDFKTHRFQFEFKRNLDLRPGKGKSGKSRIDNRDYFEFYLNRLRVKAEYEKLEKDIWKRRHFSKKSENYLENKELKRSFKFLLGKYYFLETNFNYKIIYKFLEKNIKKFDEPKDKINKRVNYENESNKNLLTENKFNYHSLRFNFKNDIISFIDQDKVNLNFKPIYSVELRKYVHLNNKNIFEETPLNKYVDLIIHRISCSVPFTLYDNSSYSDRDIDFKLKTTPKAQRSFIQGKSPREQKAPDISKVYGNQLDLEIGNVKTTYIVNKRKNYDLFEDYLAKDYTEHKGTIKIDDFNIFTFQIENKSTSNSKEKSTSNKFFQKYKIDFNYIGLGYKRDRENSYQNFEKENQYSSNVLTIYTKPKNLESKENFKNISREREEDEYSLTILGLTGKYSLKNFKNDNLINFNKKTLEKTKTRWSLEYEKDFKERYRKYKLKGSYEKEFDKIKQKYKDSVIAIHLELTDNSEVIEEKKRKEEEVKNIDIEEMEKNENKKEEIKNLDDLNTEFEKDDVFFAEEEEIDKILEDSKVKTTRTIMDLGEEIKDKKIDDKSKKILFELKLISNSTDFNLSEVRRRDYIRNLKRINLRALLKYSTYFEAESILSSKRLDIEKPYKEYEMIGRLRLQLGHRDYEWYPGIFLKRNIKEIRWDEFFGTLDHNMHCTKVGFKFGFTWNERKRKQQLAFGFNFSIIEFSEKNIGFTIRNNRVENGNFGF